MTLANKVKVIKQAIKLIGFGKKNLEKSQKIENVPHKCEQVFKKQFKFIYLQNKNFSLKFVVILVESVLKNMMLYLCFLIQNFF